MKMVEEYVTAAASLERMANDAISENEKVAFKILADEYRKLAIKRAKQFGYPIPAPPKPDVPPNLK
jgi:hypothetical protein